MYFQVNGAVSRNYARIVLTAYGAALSINDFLFSCQDDGLGGESLSNELRTELAPAPESCSTGNKHLSYRTNERGLFRA